MLSRESKRNNPHNRDSLLDMIPQLPVPAGPLIILAVLILLAVIIISWMPTHKTETSPEALTYLGLRDENVEDSSCDDVPHKRVWVIANPTKPSDFEAFRTQVNRICQAMTGNEAQWLETTIEDPGTGQAIEAIQHEPLVVLAAGGDGTVRAVAAGMAHSGYPMGIIPAGTGNLLARNLGLPLTLEGALEVAILGETRRIDLAWLHTERVVVPSDLPAEGGLLRAANASMVRSLPAGLAEPRPDEYAYLVIAGVGFDGETMANTSPKLKEAVGWSAYVFSGMKSLAIERMKATVTVFYPPGSADVKRVRKRFSPIPRKVTENIVASQTIGHKNSPTQAIHTEENWQMSVLRARTVLFANCADLPFVKLAPDAVIDDGALDVIAIDTKGGLVGWISVAAKIISMGVGLPLGNTRKGLGNIAFKQTHKARIDINRAFPVQVDGDAIGTSRTVIARTDPSALAVRVPSRSF